MSKLHNAIKAALAASVLLAALTGCQKEGPAEQAGKEVDQAIDKAGQKIENAGEKIQDAAKEGKRE